MVIEDHVWIREPGNDPWGATLGRGSVVVADAVVKGDVPSLGIVAGVPARVIGTQPEDARRYSLDANFSLFE